MSKKLNVYLADLIHDRHIYNYSVPLNVGYITAMLKQSLKDEVDSKIFKFPDELIQSMKERKPDVLALSNYDWNVNLNKAIIKIGRKINPDLYVIMGGPNIRKKPEGIKQYLENHPCDMHILNEGEDAFQNVIKHILSFWPKNIKKEIENSGIKFPNAAYLQVGTKELMAGAKPPSALHKNITFPSPWLTGLMDEFMNNEKFPLQPLLETNRNCPYQCHFCVWGDFELNKIRLFDLDTVLEEVKYIFKNSKHHFNLTIADANFGILKRDTIIAEEVRRLSDKYRKVDRVFIAQAKNSVKRNLEISKILGKISIPEFAVQTMTPGVLEYSGRKNLDNEQIKEYVAGVKANGHEVMTDILLGLPGESKDQYISSMKKVIDYGFQRASVADIRLLSGSVMAEDDYRKKFGLVSRFRVIPSAYGEYGDEKVVEYEECIRKTSTMSTEDLLELRLFNANFFLLYYLEFGRPLLDFAFKNNLHPIDLIADVSKKIDKDKYPLLSDYIKKFISNANSEWFNSEADADKHYLNEKMFANIMKNGFAKLNYEYAAQLLVNLKLRNEFLTLMGDEIKKRLGKNQNTIDEIVYFCINRVFNIEVDTNSIKEKQDDMELSHEVANHLTKYVDDYAYKSESKDDKTTRKGEIRDSFSSVSKDEDFNKNTNNLFFQNNNKSKVKISFDSDKGKNAWLKEQINRNGGNKDFLLAIQVVLQKNQKAFLRSWKINN